MITLLTCLAVVSLPKKVHQESFQRSMFSMCIPGKGVPDCTKELICRTPNFLMQHSYGEDFLMQHTLWATEACTSRTLRCIWSPCHSQSQIAYSYALGSATTTIRLQPAIVAFILTRYSLYVQILNIQIISRYSHSLQILSHCNNDSPPVSTSGHTNSRRTSISSQTIVTPALAVILSVQLLCYLG